MITIVSLGVAQGDLTRKGEEAIRSADKVLVATAKIDSYKSVLALGVPHDCLDGIYEKSRSYQTLYKNLADAVVSAEKSGRDNAHRMVEKTAVIAEEKGQNEKPFSLVYCVHGGVQEDNSAKILIRRFGGKKEKNGEERLKIVDGVSKIGVLARLANFSECSYTAISAYEPCARLSAPLIVYDMNDREIAGDVKLALADAFGDEAKVKYLYRGTVKEICVFEIDRQQIYDESSAIALEKSDLLDKLRFDMEDLKELVERLRRPDGCPWDKVQTPESIKMNVVEEAYELLDAIDSGDDGKVLEETGDILLQAAFHSVMREERGAFNLTDATSGICRKLIDRHTHVFGRDRARDEVSALSVWDKNKMKEKHQETFSDSVNDVPECFPALMRAQKIAKRLAKGGWAFDNFESVEKKLIEELAELKSAYADGKGDQEKIADELGDVLMCAAWLGRAVGADCEEALLKTVKKLQKRYAAFESAVLADGKDVNALSEEEWDMYYRAAKNATGDGKISEKNTPKNNGAGGGKA